MVFPGGTYRSWRIFGEVVASQKKHLISKKCPTLTSRKKNQGMPSWFFFLASAPFGCAINGVSEPACSVQEEGAEKAEISRADLQESLRNLLGFPDSTPLPRIMKKGEQTSVQFMAHPEADTTHLLLEFVSRNGKLASGPSGEGPTMEVTSWVSPVARQITVSPRSTGEGSGSTQEASIEKSGALSMTVFFPLLNQAPAEVEIMKNGQLDQSEVETIASCLAIAKDGQDRESERGERVQSSPPEPDQKMGRKGGEESRQMGRDALDSGAAEEGKGREKGLVDQAVRELTDMGVRVYGVEGAPGVSQGSGADLGVSAISWDNFAGYEEQKRQIEDTVLLALRYPHLYDSIARGTRTKFESNRPRAVLFEGPPGTGKTSSARVISSQSGIPLLYVPLEAIASKYYGEAEKLLSSVFQCCRRLPNGGIVFVDEIDALAASRDSEMHEATRRVLSVLLRQMDGFEEGSKVVLIAATNRKTDLDPALISRFDTIIHFSLPDRETRRIISAQYARHLTESEMLLLSDSCDEMSGRDIRDICEQTERRWASKVIRQGQGKEVHLPPLEEYLASAKMRRSSIVTK